EVSGDIDAEPVRAHPGGLHPTLRPDGQPRELDHRAGGQHAHDRGRPAYGQALDGLPAQGRAADGLEGVIDARARGERAHRLDRLVPRAVDDMGGAQAPGHLELRVEHVDRDDLPGASAIRAPCTMDNPTPPQPNTATVWPASSPAVRRAAPTPVRTPQPTRAARSSGMSGSIFTTEFSWSSIRSA